MKIFVRARIRSKQSDIAYIDLNYLPYSNQKYLKQLCLGYDYVITNICVYIFGTLLVAKFR